MPDTVSLESPFYKGVIAGNRVIEETLPAAAAEGVDENTKNALYWFYCGLIAHAEYGLTSTDDLGLFMVGAKTVAPQLSGFTLTFSTDNAAFRKSVEGPMPVNFDDAGDDEVDTMEVARVIRDVASKVDDGYDRANVLDANGRTVGSWSLS